MNERSHEIIRGWREEERGEVLKRIYSVKQLLYIVYIYIRIATSIKSQRRQRYPSVHRRFTVRSSSPHERCREGGGVVLDEGAGQCALRSIWEMGGKSQYVMKTEE